MIKDYYQILSIDKTSDSITIKKAYRKLALLYHPDINKRINANDQFIRITEAYEVLINDRKRRDYDLLYNKYFNKDIPVKVEDAYASTKSTEWEEYGNSKASEYGNLNINDFLKYVFGEAIYHTKQVSKIGCSAYLWIGTGITGLIGTPFAIFGGFADDEELGFVIFMTIFMLLISIVIIVVGVRNMRKQISEYKKETSERKKWHQ